jgi:glutathione S-transferase
MSVHLYYSAGSCSMVPHIALVELGIAHTASAAPVAGSAERAAYLKNVNALGAVPALVLEDGRVITQNLAIVDYLVGQVGDNTLLPVQTGYARSQVLRWFSFANADVHPAFKAAFRPAMFSDNEADHATLRAKSEKAVVALFQFADAEYAQRDWIAGEFSVADLYLYTTLRWATLMGFDLSSVPHLKGLATRVQAKPSVMTVLALHGKEPL